MSLKMIALALSMLALAFNTLAVLTLRRTAQRMEALVEVWHEAAARLRDGGV